MAQLIAEGDRCFVDEEYGAAIEQYSKAIEQNPNNALAYEARAKAHIACHQYEEALQDAQTAVELDPQFAKAYLQQGIACFHMEEYEAAKDALEAGYKLAPTITKFKAWLRKCEAELEEERANGGAPATATTAAPAPAPAAPAPQPVTAVEAPAPAAATAAPSPAPAPAAASNGAGSSAEDAAKPLAPAAPIQYQGKYRHQHYHIQDKVVVDVYAKKLAKDRVHCEFGEERLLCVINDAEGQEEYRLEVDLYGKIVPDQCKVEVLGTKVEISMKKADQKAWATLEKSDKVAAPNFSDPNFHNPSYPTSYTKAPKDWSSVEAELKEQEEKGELEFGDPLNNFFKKIFSQGTDEQRRAMMKSFQESNGTVLSTNWEEVGTKKVECTPPDGMELKKFEH